jgi:putative heme-binding domain-containing protein
LIGIGGEASALVVGALARPDSPAALQAAIIAAMDEKGSVTELVGNLNGLKAELRSQAFDAILKRPEAALALLGAIREGKIDPKEIGPGNIARLRTHPNKQVAKQANAMIDKLNPNAKAKNELLAQLTPEVEKPGDAVKGKAMFAAACAVCHKLGDLGLRDVGPQLTGMGAHGPAELLVHIVDPNREVDPSFWAWNITTKKGETQAGVIITENQASLTLRNQVGDFEIKKDDIATRENTRRSLMPDGLDALGAETLRDILAFICGGEQKFRVIDLRTAYNADSRAGIFAKEDAKDQTVTLHKFGNVTVNGVPFFVMDPEKSQTGASLIALKGGGKGTVAENFPEKIEIATSATAASLHFLGGVAGWGWPFGGDKALGQPAMTVQVEFADGDKESIVLKNGEHFADYIGKAEVPLSDDAGDFTRRGQLRYFAINLKKKGALKKITLETSGSIVTPCTVAITASMEPAKLGAAVPKPKANAEVRGAPETGPKEGGKGDGPLVAVMPVNWEAGKTKVLVIGGGSSHNFAKFFGETDVATLKAAGFTVHYTEDRDQAAAELANADVAVISVNRKFFDTAVYRKALMDFAAAGKGIIMLHPGTWYGFGGWPELNAHIVGGGARGHDKIHPFDVKAVKADHPIMAGVPASFTVEDELYYVNAEPEKIPAGTAKITVLAETSPSDKYKAGHPSVWITEHAKAKVVGIALGHDARVHDLRPYQQILTNAVKWASGK